MTVVREPLLEPVPILELRPTQITVGLNEVAERRAHWRKLKKDARALFLERHMIPVVGGPKGRLYVVDHHHLALALHEEGVARVFVTVAVDLKKVDPKTFWFVMDCRGLMHPFDAAGKRRSHDDLPKSVKGLVDDPYRSLAGMLRRVGGFAKDTTPFSEFLWADFLRRRIARRLVVKDFRKATKQAYALARSKDADYLPGWSGPVDET